MNTPTYTVTTTQTFYIPEMQAKDGTLRYTTAAFRTYEDAVGRRRRLESQYDVVLDIEKDSDGDYVIVFENDGSGWMPVTLWNGAEGYTEAVRVAYLRRGWNVRVDVRRIPRDGCEEVDYRVYIQ